jgi:hypothetical protein
MSNQAAAPNRLPPHSQKETARNCVPSEEAGRKMWREHAQTRISGPLFILTPARTWQAI